MSEHTYRSHTSGELRKEHEGNTVRLAGWVHARRDHGGLVFIDVRDTYGVTQLTFDPQKNKEAWDIAQTLRSEYVVTVEGVVVLRPEEMVNSALDTGDVEVQVHTIRILSTSKTPPFEISGGEVHEDIRLKYRFLDLRREKMQQILKKKDEFITHIRSYMHKEGFVEVQTPILANSSPEGARDFLVPSRLHPGSFYALPQAPQQYKQLLMASGVDKYFQIAPCMRDEDPRADRHAGEFYQLDIEMSFVEQEDVFNLIEPLMIDLTETFSDKQIVSKPFTRLAWRDAMTTYGTDKPDLRYDFRITDITDSVRDSEFGVFSSAIESGGVVHALHVPGGASCTRKDIDDLTETAKAHGAKGLAYILVKDELTSPILKYVGEDCAKQIVEAVGAKKGDMVCFGADAWLAVCKALGAVRSHAADILGVKDDSKAAWCWVVDFPMYEYDDVRGKIDFSHNPFSMPQGGRKALEAQDPTTILGYQYDICLNGFEISSGAIRNHDIETMYRAFEIAGYTKQDVDTMFGGIVNAFSYGAPPHGGIAPGIDRLFMVLMDVESIRDVYAFPKNNKAQDVMMNSPTPVDPALLKELGLHVDVEK